MIDAAESARTIVEALRETEAESEDARVLSGRAVELLHQAELTQLVTPAAFGGHQRSPRALVEAERVVAHGSPTASWVLMVTGAHTFIAGRLPLEGQAEIFDGTPGMLIPGVPSPRGTCHKVDGGYVVSGRWPYASGADHGDWVIVGARGIRNEADESCPSLLVFVPKANVELDDTWFTLGMRGTGSKDLILDNVFVPEHLAVPMGAAQQGTLPDVDVALYRLPIRPTLATFLLGTIVGMSQRGLELFMTQARTRIDAYTGAEKVHSAGIQRRVAEASGEISCAWSLTMQNCDLLEAAMERPEPMAIGDRAQVRWNAAYAAELCQRAATRLFTGAGSGATFDANVLQGVFRDITTATRHAMLDLDNHYEMQGKNLLGVELEDAAV